MFPLSGKVFSIFTTLPLPHLPPLPISPVPMHTFFHFPQEKHWSFLIHFLCPLYFKGQLKLGALPPYSFGITALTKLNCSWFSHLPPCTWLEGFWRAVIDALIPAFYLAQSRLSVNDGQEMSQCRASQSWLKSQWSEAKETEFQMARPFLGVS